MTTTILDKVYVFKVLSQALAVSSRYEWVRATNISIWFYMKGLPSEDLTYTAQVAVAPFLLYKLFQKANVCGMTQEYHIH